MQVPGQGCALHPAGTTWRRERARWPHGSGGRGKAGPPPELGSRTGGWMGRGMWRSSRPAIRVPPRASAVRNNTNTFKSPWCVGGEKINAK